MATSKLKNNKIKRDKKGSEITFYRRQKSNRIKVLPTTDDQSLIPKWSGLRIIEGL